MIERLVGLAARLPLVLVHLLAGALSFGESAVLLDLLVPGEVSQVFLGAAVRRRGGSLPVAIAAVAVGALAGDAVGWWLGRRFGLALVCRWRWTRRKLAPEAERASRLLERHGGPVVVAGRWVGALRAVVPLVAGTTGMPFRRFIAWDVPAAITWSAAIVSLGWFLGDRAAKLVDRFDTALVAVAAVAVAAYLVVRWRRRRSGHGRHDPDGCEACATLERRRAGDRPADRSGVA